MAEPLCTVSGRRSRFGDRCMTASEADDLVMEARAMEDPFLLIVSGADQIIYR